MAAECFLDTNILLYAYDLDAPEKRAVAARLLERAWREPGSSAISVQVLQEFFVNFIRSVFLTRLGMESSTDVLALEGSRQHSQREERAEPTAGHAIRRYCF